MFIIFYSKTQVSKANQQANKRRKRQPKTTNYDVVGIIDILS